MKNVKKKNVKEMNNNEIYIEKIIQIFEKDILNNNRNNYKNYIELLDEYEKNYIEKLYETWFIEKSKIDIRFYHDNNRFLFNENKITAFYLLRLMVDIDFTDKDLLKLFIKTKNELLFNNKIEKDEELDLLLEKLKIKLRTKDE